MTELRKHCVYMHTNKENGKRYIGLTSLKPKYRWNGGKGYKANEAFFDDILAYGWNNFEHEVIKDNLTETEARALEAQLIYIFDTTNPNKGYNKYSNNSQFNNK